MNDRDKGRDGTSSAQANGNQETTKFLNGRAMDGRRIGGPLGLILLIHVSLELRESNVVRR